MKQPKFKIYKQVGIQELAPHKINVKLFKHLLISRYTFLYFFYRGYINDKYNKIKLKLNEYIIPFIYPISKDIHTHFDRNYADDILKLNLNDKIKKQKKIEIKSKCKFIKYPLFHYKIKKRQLLNKNLLSNYYLNYNYKLNNDIYFNDKLNKFNYKLIKFRGLKKYKKNPNKFFKNRNHFKFKYNRKKKTNFFWKERSNKIKPYKSFKFKQTGSPLVHVKPLSDLLDINLTLFQDNNIKIYNSNYGYNNDSSNLFDLMLAFQKFYLKLSFINLDNLKDKFNSILYNKRYKFLMYVRYKKMINFIKKILIKINMIIHFILTSNSYIRMLLFTRYKIYINLIYNIILKYYSKIRCNYINTLYNNTNYNINKINKLKKYKSQFIKIVNKKKFYNIGWFNLMKFFFPRFLYSNDKMFLKKHFINKFRINFLIYKKYLGELTRSETLNGFIKNITKYKQKRVLHKFFYKLHKKSFSKFKNKKYHDIGSYYNLNFRILSLLLNRRAYTKHKRIFHYRNRRVKLFRIKLYKILFKIRRTGKCLPLLKNNKFFNNLLKVKNIFNSIKNWIKDLWHNKFIKYNNNKIYKNEIFKKNYILGDVVNFFNNSLTKSNVFQKHEFLNFLKFIHFYLSALSYFINRNSALFKFFNKYYFFLFPIKYKLSHIFIKYFFNFFFKYKKKKKKINEFIIKKSLPLINNNNIYYININSNYLNFHLNPIYIGVPINLSNANLNAFFDYKLGLRSKKNDNIKLKFLNFFYYKTNNYNKFMHKKYHIDRYLKFIKGIKSYIISGFNNYFANNKYTMIIIETIKNESYITKDNILSDIENKLHYNKIDKLIIGNLNFVP